MLGFPLPLKERISVGYMYHYESCPHVYIFILLTGIKICVLMKAFIAKSIPDIYPKQRQGFLLAVKD